MSRAKPLSLEVKVERILSLLQEKNEIYNLKDLEKISQKEKGVVPQSVKEVLDILISENRAKEKKIGIYKYYWSFPSDARVQKEAKHKKIVGENEALRDQKTRLTEEVDQMKKNRETLPDRKEKLDLLKKRKEKYKEIEEKMKLIQENDPMQMVAIEEELSSLKKDLTEWADAFNILQSHIKNTYNMNRTEFCKAFSITMADMEKIEDL